MKEIESLPESMKNKIKIPSPLTIYQVQGCKRCNSRGFVGRIGVFEILVMTDSLAKIISREPEESKISEEAVRQGMITMRQDGILKVLDGVTTLEEVLRVAEEK